MTATIVSIRYTSPDRRHFQPPAMTLIARVSVEGYSAEEVAEAVYSAVEAPFTLTVGDLGWYFQREVFALREANVPVWGLMVGDTVTIETGDSTTSLRIASVGWEVVED